MPTYIIPKVRSLLETKIAEGKKVYKIGKRVSIDTGLTEEFVFQNPSNSGKIAHVVALRVRGKAEGDVDIYLNSTIQTNGTEIKPAPATVGDTTPSAMHVEYGGTYVKNSTPIKTEDVIPGGSGNFASGGENEGGFAGDVPPGELIHVVVTNTSTKAADYTFRMVWWED